MWTIELLVMVAMIAVNSVFAAYELALASVSLGRLDALAREGRVGAAAAVRMKQGMEGSLAVVQLGITLVGAIAAATGGAGAEEWIEPILMEGGFGGGVAQLLAIALVVVPLTVFTIIFGELVPKVFALKNKEWVCLRISPPMEWFSKIVWPAVWFLESSVSLIMSWSERRWRPDHKQGEQEHAALQELRAVAALARTSRLIGKREEGIIVSAVRLADTPVRDAMLPAEYISMLAIDDPLHEALIAAHHDMHTRFPVARQRGDPQTIAGYANFKDIVAAMRLSPDMPSLRGILRRLPDCRAGESVSECLERLIREHQHIALVREKDGTVVGLITLEDILEELVGEIHDEYDRVPGFLITAGEGWIAGGNVGLERFNELTGATLEIPQQPHPGTLSDWIAHRLGHPPRGGEILQEQSLRIIVRKVRRNRVQEAWVGRSSSATPTPHQQSPPGREKADSRSESAEPEETERTERIW
jgi:putative hemolysin